MPLKQQYISVLSEYKGSKIEFVNETSSFILSYLDVVFFKVGPEKSTAFPRVKPKRC